MVLEEELEEDGKRSESSWRPSFSDWTMLHELTARNGDLLIRLMATKPADFPRPLSAAEALREELEEARMQAGYDRVMDEVEAAQARWRAMTQEERDAMGVQ